MGTNQTEIRVELTRAEQGELERISRSQVMAHREVTRAKVILLLAARQSLSATAHEVGLQRRIVRKWARRFQEHRLSGLDDLPRSGRPARFSP